MTIFDEEEITPADQLRYDRWQRYERLKRHKSILQVFENMLMMDSDILDTLGITYSSFNEARQMYKDRYYSSLKTFVVCPTCDTAITGKKRRNAIKSISDYDCNICGASSWKYNPIITTYQQQNRKIHHTQTLAEVKQSHPELLL